MGPDEASRRQTRVRALGLCAGLGILLLAVLYVSAATTRSPEGGPAGASAPLPPLSHPRIVITKGERRLELFDGAALVRTYRAALGGDPTGAKLREGDRRTPEGVYYVCTRNERSRYRLSLGLSYPNAADAARGLAAGTITQAQHDAIRTAIAAGARPPWDSPLGGEIMIHGNGAGRDWTLGCIALDDADIDELFAAVPMGTPVEIRP